MSEIEYYLHLPFVATDDHHALVVGSAIAQAAHGIPWGEWGQPQVTRHDRPGIPVTIATAEVTEPAPEQEPDAEPVTEEPTVEPAAEPVEEEDYGWLEDYPSNPPAKGPDEVQQDYAESLDAVLARYIPAEA